MDKPKYCQSCKYYEQPECKKELEVKYVRRKHICSYWEEDDA